jgi:hypothetical protein
MNRSIHPETQMSALESLRKQVDRPGLSIRELEAWTTQHGKEEVSARMAMAPTDEDYWPDGRMSAKVEAVIDDISSFSLIHGHDRYGRMVHYELTGRASFPQMRARHKLSDIIHLKQIEFSYYVHVARQRSWLRFAFGDPNKLSLLQTATAASTDGSCAWEVKSEYDPSSISVLRTRRPVSAAVRTAVDSIVSTMPAYSDQMLSVVDMQGAHSDHISTFARAFCKEVSGIAESRMPDGPYQVIVINAPWVVQAAWTAVRPFLNQRIVSLIEVHKDNGQARLRELIDPAQIPTEFGGTCQCCSEGCLSHKAPDQARKIAWMRSRGAGAMLRDHLLELLLEEVLPLQE